MNTVLAIDPDDCVRLTVENMCRDWGVYFFGTSQLLEGRKIWKTQNPDLIFIDLFIPGKSAFAFVDEVTTQEVHPSVVATFSPLKAPRIKVEQFTRLLGVLLTLQKPLERLALQGVFQDLFPCAGDPLQQELSRHQYR